MSGINGRRKWSAAEKLRVVLAGMQAGVGGADLCRREGINASQYSLWKKKLLGAALRGDGGGAGGGAGLRPAARGAAAPRVGLGNGGRGRGGPEPLDGLPDSQGA